MNIKNRVDRLEGASGAGESCPMCERRAASVESSPVMLAGLAKTPDDTYTLNCPRCGAPFTIQVVYVSRKEAA